MKKGLYLFFIILLILFSCKRKTDITQFVNSFVGTGGHGHTYPGASLPFGMVQLSPDTRFAGWDGCSGYHYSDKIIYGFSHTHLSGTGVSDYADILVMPMTGDYTFLRIDSAKKNDGYCSTFNKNTETANPGYYSVFLEKSQIKAELTATKRCGFHQYTFPETKNGFLIFDLSYRDEVLASSIKQISETEIEGFRESTGWAKDQFVYFVAKFSKPIKTIHWAKNDSLKENAKMLSGKNIKMVLGFGEFIKSDKLLVKVGISAVDEAGARKNLETEIPDWDFQSVKEKAKLEWNKELGKIEISGNKTDKTIFYTALYHSLLTPNLFMDVDNRYRGTDLKIHQANDFENYTVFSLWDTYRATHPLFTIIERKRTLDFIKTFLHQYKNGRQLPVWELAGNYTGCMIGYHAVSVIADAYIKGINEFDTKLALEAMKSSAIDNKLGLKYYKQLGYIPSEKESESVSKTLEYAYDDWCIAQMANKMKDTSDYKYFIMRAQNYKNSFNPETGFMEPKYYGAWKYPFDAKEVDFNYTEANSWQYSFYVPQDIQGMISLMGGKENFAKQLDRLFNETTQTTGRQQADITGLIGQYAHGNEPSHHIAYLYDYCTQPWKTQKRVHQICKEMYSNNPDGLAGNEDCGQMSSWYVLSSLGFYQVTPGSKVFAIGTPTFKKAIINLENGKQFTIVANNLSPENFYIQSIVLNGKAYEKLFINYDDIINGSNLTFNMGPKPNKNLGQDKESFPLSEITDHLILPVPYNNVKRRIFTDTIRVKLFSIIPDAKIYYSLNPNDAPKIFKPYKSSLTITKTTTIRYFTKKYGYPESKIVSLSLYQFPKGRSIHLKYPPHKQYSGETDSALIDGIRAEDNFRLGGWQGFYGVDLDAVVDLGKPTMVSEVSADFLQDINSWIFMPESVTYEYSNDGKHFSFLKTVKCPIAEDNWSILRTDFKYTFRTKKFRYLHIIGKTGKYCPAWHKGHGNQLFIFCDEITIK